MAISALIPALLAGCAATPEKATTAPSAELQTFHVEGYPIDRSLDGIASWGLLETAVVLTDLSTTNSVWLTEDGKAPSLAKAENGEIADQTPLLALATPVRGKVSQVLWGKPVGDTATVFVDGGTADGVEVTLGDEVSVSPDKLLAKGQIVVAGSIETRAAGTGIHPAFIYEVGQDGETLVSLLQSASDELHPTFKLSDLRERLQARA